VVPLPESEDKALQPTPGKEMTVAESHDKAAE
jgi:hypothetical protein